MATKRARKTKQNFSAQELAAIAGIQQETGVSRKTAIKKMRTTQASIKKIATPVAPAPAPESSKTEAPKPTKTAPKTPLPANVVGANRAAGIALFKLAGKPTREQFITVYGAKGPSMTWEQRAAAGVPAEQFQAALASAQGQK